MVHRTSLLTCILELFKEFLIIRHRAEILKADVSSVSPSSERIEKLWDMCSFYSRVGDTLLVVTWQREK